jgi:hypothetical protein
MLLRIFRTINLNKNEYKKKSVTKKDVYYNYFFQIDKLATKSISHIQNYTV